MDYSFGVAEVIEPAIEALAQEDRWMRLYDRSSKPGGLVLLKEDIPTWVLPDLHGRIEFLKSFMNSDYQGKTMRERLAAGEGQVVCLGDAMHTESASSIRWSQAFKEFGEGFEDAEKMEAEMKVNFQTMALVMELKTAFGPYFHFLKGNHENILDRSEGANRTVSKFAAESTMVRAWVLRYLGEGFLDQFAAFEDSLPILARGRNFLCAHTQPMDSYSFEQVTDYRDNPEVVYGLTWTRPSQADPEAVGKMLKDFLGGDQTQSVMVVGHTPINELYNWDANQKLLQIHNPDRQVVCLLQPGRGLQVDQDIFEFGF